MNHLLKSLALGLALCASTTFALPGTVNVNTANAQELSEMLDGVGLARAQAIVEYREQYGAIDSLAQLQEVSGIGPATVDANRDVIAFTE